MQELSARWTRPKHVFKVTLAVSTIVVSSTACRRRSKLVWSCRLERRESSSRIRSFGVSCYGKEGNLQLVYPLIPCTHLRAEGWLLHAGGLRGLIPARGHISNEDRARVDMSALWTPSNAALSLGQYGEVFGFDGENA